MVAPARWLRLQSVRCRNFPTCNSHCNNGHKRVEVRDPADTASHEPFQSSVPLQGSCNRDGKRVFLVSVFPREPMPIGHAQPVQLIDVVLEIFFL